MKTFVPRNIGTVMEEILALDPEAETMLRGDFDELISAMRYCPPELMWRCWGELALILVHVLGDPEKLTGWKLKARNILADVPIESANPFLETPDSKGVKERIPGLFRDNPKTPEGKYLVKRRDGTVPDWPSFVLGARDPHAVPALLAYADSIEKDSDCHPDFPNRIRKLAKEFSEYREEHGAGDPTRGAHRVDDPETVMEMKKGRGA